MNETKAMNWVERPEGFSEETYSHIGDVKAENVNGDWYISDSPFKPYVRDATKDVTRPAGDDIYFAEDGYLFRISKPSYAGLEWFVMVFQVKCKGCGEPFSDPDDTGGKCDDCLNIDILEPPDPEEKFWKDQATYAERHSDHGEDY